MFRSLKAINGLSRQASLLVVATNARVASNTPKASYYRFLHVSSGIFQLDTSKAESVIGQPDPFTAQLQAKTESELFELLQKNRARFEGRVATVDENEDLELKEEEGEEEIEDEEEESGVNAETGESMGPKGKEPTRFGDWEIKGRCSDF